LARTITSQIKINKTKARLSFGFGLKKSQAKPKLPGKAKYKPWLFGLRPKPEHP
jgi:hypothetical protein